MNNVCHLSSHHSSESIRIFKKQCISLSKAGYDVTYVVAGEGPEMKNGVRMAYIKQQKGIFHRLFFKPYKIYKKAKALNADIYHFHDPELLPYGFLLKRAGKKVIYDIHEDLPAKIKDFGSPMYRPITVLISVFVDYIEKFVARRLSYNVTVNEEIRKKFTNTNITVITNYPIINLFDKANNSQTHNDTPIVVYAGMLNKRRGIKEVIDACGVLRGRVTLALLGSWQNQAYYAECKNSIGWKYTNYMGVLPLKQAYSVIQQSDLGIVNFLPLINHYNSMPNKAFEYMAAGKPIIMSSFPYWQKLFKECAVFADPKSPTAISEAILSLINNKKLMTTLGANAKRLVYNAYSWEAESKKLINLYQNKI